MSHKVAPPEENKPMDAYAVTEIQPEWVLEPESLGSQAEVLVSAEHETRLVI